MVESEIAGRIAARRAELGDLEEQLAKRLEEVRAERYCWSRTAGPA